MLFRSAYCLLYLSEYEGFGLPVAEAEQCGCPVVALNRSSIPEIAEGSELVLLADSIQVCPLNLQHVQSKEKFSWTITYERLKMILDSIHGNN